MTDSTARSPSGREGGGRIQADLVQISAHLAQLAGDLARDVEATRGEPRLRLSYVDFARRLIDDRRERNERFGAELFSDPAWDILLDLFVAAGERKNISVSSVSIGAGVPLTTALRWIGTMTDAGLLTRAHDPFDRRRVHISLTESAFVKVRAYLDGIAGRWGVALQGILDPVIV